MNYAELCAIGVVTSDYRSDKGLQFVAAALRELIVTEGATTSY